MKGKYRMTGREIAGYTFVFIALSATVSFLFYDSVYAFFIISSLFPAYIAYMSKKNRLRRSTEMKSQFCDMLESLKTSISAGISPENSIIISRNYLEKIYGEKAMIVVELGEMIASMNVGVPLSKCLESFAQGTGTEEIKDFASIFSEVLVTGGEISRVIKDTAEVIKDKRRTEEEIEAMLKGKMLEQKVICIVPFLILMYLRVSGGDFIEVLYHNAGGVLIMTVCLVLYIFSFILSEKIINIQV